MNAEEILAKVRKIQKDPNGCRMCPFYKVGLCCAIDYLQEWIVEMSKK